MNDMSIVKKSFVSYIDKIILNNKVSHCYLIEIDDYDKDFSYVMSFIKMILFHQTSDHLDSLDASIVSQIDNGDYPDIMVIEPDGNWIKKSQLMALQKEYSNKSLIGTKRFYIIKNAECLNAASANTMLKFLEEPEDNIYAFLVTDNRYHVLDTILSRCQVLSLKENSFSFFLDEATLSILKGITDPNYFFIHYNFFITDVLKDKNIVFYYFDNIEKIFVSFLHSKYDKNFLIKMNDEITSIISTMSDEQLLFSLKVIEDDLSKLHYNVNFKLWLDAFFSKLVIGG